MLILHPVSTYQNIIPPNCLGTRDVEALIAMVLTIDVDHRAKLANSDITLGLQWNTEIKGNSVSLSTRRGDFFLHVRPTTLITRRETASYSYLRRHQGHSSLL
jgi:hypothetical protein